MAANFGFIPSGRDDAYFVSYNTEDAERVAQIAREMHDKGVPLWYDYGLEYGEEWERQIAEHIDKCRAVILFVTKNLVKREGLSYVRIEYDLARKDFHKTVYIVMLDTIKSEDVSNFQKIWWRELNYLHCITQPTADNIMRAMGCRAVSNVPSAGGMSAKELYNKGHDYYWGRNGTHQDYTQAVHYYRLAAEQGHADAQYSLGVCYDYGQGVPQDYTQSVHYYRLAAEQGDADAQNNLGICYDYGQGVPQDYTQAVHYYRLAAEQGDADAQNNLGNCYEHGQGVEKNLDEAIRLYKLSAAEGNEVAKNNLERLGVK